MTLPRLYADLAYLWPLLAPPEDYVAEAEAVRRVLRERLGPAAGSGGSGRSGSSEASGGGRARILEFGAGGGHTLVHLAEEFECTAVDLSSAMLAHCEQLVPTADCYVGDMRDFDVRATFDAVLIHDAVDYLTSEGDVLATLANAHRHLRPGGVVIVAPTYTTETFAEHDVASDHRDGDGFDVTYFSYVHDPDPRDTWFELILVYLLRKGGDVRIEHDRHRCGLFPRRQWVKLLREAGFTVDAKGRAADGDDGSPGVMLVGTAKKRRGA